MMVARIGLILLISIVVLGTAVVQAQDDAQPCESFTVYPIVAVEGEPLIIRWDACAGAVSYRVLVVAGGSDIVVDETVTGTSLSVDLPLQAGDLFGGVVAAKDAAGDTISETIFDPFSVLAAGNTPGTVNGTVTWNGQPVPDIPVFLGLACYSPVIQTTLTDEDGFFEFTRVAPDAYTVRVNYRTPEADRNPDYTLACPQKRAVLAPEGEIMINVSLSRRDLNVDRPDSPSDQTVTIAWEAYPDAVSYTVEPKLHPEMEQTTSETSITLSGLIPWETHNVTITAYNAAGDAISEGSTGQFEVVIPGQARPTPTPVPPPAFNDLTITTDQQLIRGLMIIEVQPGDTLELSLAAFQCCYFLEQVEVYDPVWTVEPSEVATLDPVSGTLTIADDAPNGAELTITASYEDQALTETVYVYRPDENPLVGTWYETAQINCDSGDEVQISETTIGELMFQANGTYYVTWQPFEVYFDYEGTYHYDLATGDLVLTAETINYLPPDFEGEGAMSLDADGDLLITGINLGAPPFGDYWPGCGYRFVRR